MAKITTPESLYGNSRDILREAERENEILADIAGEEYESPGDIPKGKYVIEKRLLDAAQKKNELLESIAEGGGGGGGGAAKAIGIDYATDVISLKDKDGETIAGSGATLPAYGVSFDPTTGGLTLTKNGTAVSGQTVTIPNYGSPVGVTSSSDMTDHDTIYLYEGTTSGSYTNGHFYYWDGSAWADGGEYAAATVQTDKTLLVEDRAADAKATGEAIGELKTQIDAEINSTQENAGIKTGSYVNNDILFFNGSLSETGDFAPGRTDRATTDFLYIPDDAAIATTVKTGYSKSLDDYWYNENREFISKSRDGIVPAGAKYVRFIVFKSDSTQNITPYEAKTNTTYTITLPYSVKMIGNTALPTTAQTLTGAIAEHDSEIKELYKTTSNTENALISTDTLKYEKTGTLYSSYTSADENTPITKITETIALDNDPSGIRFYAFEVPLDVGSEYLLRLKFNEVHFRSDGRYKLAVIVRSDMPTSSNYTVQTVHANDADDVGEDYFFLQFVPDITAVSLGLRFYFGTGSQDIDVDLYKISGIDEISDDEKIEIKSDCICETMNVDDFMEFTKLRYTHHDNFHRADNVSELGNNGDESYPMNYEIIYKDTSEFPIGIINNTAYSTNPSSFSDKFAFALVEAPKFPYLVSCRVAESESPLGYSGRIIIGYESKTVFSYIQVQRNSGATSLIDNVAIIPKNKNSIATPVAVRSKFGRFDVLNVVVYPTYFEIYADSEYITTMYCNNTLKSGMYFDTRTDFRYSAFNVAVKDNYTQYGFEDVYRKYGFIYSENKPSSGKWKGRGFFNMATTWGDSEENQPIIEDTDIKRYGAQSIKYRLNYEQLQSDATDSDLNSYSSRAETNFQDFPYPQRNLRNWIFDFDMFFPASYVPEIIPSGSGITALSTGEIFLQIHQILEYPGITLRVQGGSTKAQSNQVRLTTAGNSDKVEHGQIWTDDVLLFTVEPGTSGCWHHFTLFVREGYDVSQNPIAIVAVDGVVKGISRALNTYNILAGGVPHFGLYKSLWASKIKATGGRTNPAPTVDENGNALNDRTWNIANFKMWY